MYVIAYLDNGEVVGGIPVSDVDEAVDCMILWMQIDNGNGEAGRFYYRMYYEVDGGIR